MGATNFGTVSVGKFENARQAFRDAQREYEEYYGSDPYSGTIKEVDTFRVFNNAPKYGTKAFYKFQEEWLDRSDTQVCGCIEITGKKLKELKEQNGLKGKKGIKAFLFFGWARC